jgi:hypothetical protein
MCCYSCRWFFVFSLSSCPRPRAALPVFLPNGGGFPEPDKMLKLVAGSTEKIVPQWLKKSRQGRQAERQDFRISLIKPCIIIAAAMRCC